MNLSNKAVVKLPRSNFSWELLPWLLSLVIVGIIGVSYKTLPDQVPLYYSLPWGKDQLAPKYELFIVPVALLFVDRINSVLIHKFQKTANDFLFRVLQVSGLICNLMGGITVVQIIKIIT